MSGQLALSKQAEWVAKQRQDDRGRRSDYYRHAGGLTEEVYSIARAGDVVPISMALKFLELSNLRAAKLFHAFTDQFGALPSAATRSGYDMALKDCVDARSAVLSPFDYMLRTVLEERTAAVGVRSGHVFRLLHSNGRGFVLTHTGCGGEKVAHDAVCGKSDGTPIDGHIARIVETVPAGVARIDDAERRSVLNAKVQAFMAREMLVAEDVNRSIDAAMLHWDTNMDSAVHWLANPSAPHEWAKDMQTTARDGVYMIREFNAAQLSTHWALASFFYDATQMPVSSMHALFDLHQNMGFCVTANFGKESGESFAGSAVGSLRYAISHGGEGHVNGIGHNKGASRLIIVPGCGAADLAEVKAQLIASSPELRDLTRGGETIIRAYLSNHVVRFDESDVRKIDPTWSNHR
jgi:carbonic anhydrase